MGVCNNRLVIASTDPMNRYQKAVATMAALNILLLLLFPPFVDNPIQRGAPRSFEGFYFLLMAPAGHAIDEPLLSLEVLLVVINALAAWLALTVRVDDQPHLTETAAARGLFLFGAANLVLIFLFPPFEPYSSLLRVAAQDGFDGFYFVLGDKRHRHIFLPLLYLEVIFVAINLLVAWLVFSLIRGGVSATDEQLIQAAHRVAPDKVDALIHALEENSAVKAAPAAQLGRRKERRRRTDPKYRGPERRGGNDRRNERR